MAAATGAAGTAFATGATAADATFFATGAAAAGAAFFATGAAAVDATFFATGAAAAGAAFFATGAAAADAAFFAAGLVDFSSSALSPLATRAPAARTAGAAAFEAFAALARVGATERCGATGTFATAGLRAWATGFVGAAAGFAPFTGSFALDTAGLTGAFAATFAPWRTADAFDAARVAAGALVVRADVDLPARDVAARLGALDRADFALVFALVLGIGIVRSKKPVSLIDYVRSMLAKKLCPVHLAAS